MKWLMLVLVITVPTVVLGHKKTEDKTYPEQGSVISMDTMKEVGGTVIDGDGSIGTSLRAVYRVQTATATYDITGWEPAWKSRKRPALQLKDVIQFRIENNYVFANLSDGKEHRFRIVAKKSNEVEKP